MADVTIDGIRVVLEGEITSGGPVIFAVHGSGGGAWLWRRMRNALAERASIIAVDLPGHGATGFKGLTSIEDYRETVRTVAGELGLERPFAMGHSMGGAVILDWAINYPEELAGLVLVATGARLRVKQGIFQSIKENYDGYLAGLEKAAFGEDVPNDVLEETRKHSKLASSETTYNDFVACDNFDIMEEIERINLPALVLCGDSDLLTPLKYSEYSARKMPDAQLKTFPGAGHMLPVERPAQAADAIMDWLGTIE